MRQTDPTPSPFLIITACFFGLKTLQMDMYSGIHTIWNLPTAWPSGNLRLHCERFAFVGNPLHYPTLDSHFLLMHPPFPQPLNRQESFNAEVYCNSLSFYLFRLLRMPVTPEGFRERLLQELRSMPAEVSRVAADSRFSLFAQSRHTYPLGGYSVLHDIMMTAALLLA